MIPGRISICGAGFLALAFALGHSKSDAASSVLEWTQFRDPSENAFALDVPQGWTVRGGLFRLGYSDARVMVDIQSPDGRTDIRLGDAAIPSYFVPNQFHRAEGEIYDLGAQAQMVVARYRSGTDYARLYSLARFTGVCKSLTPQSITNSEPPIQDLPQPMAPLQASGGEIAYRCDSGPQERVAYVYAKTSLFKGFWQVTSLVSFLTPVDRTEQARQILLHCTKSLRLAPEWIQHQQEMDAEGLQYQRARQLQRRNEISQQVQQFEAKMSSMRAQVNAFERRQNAQAAQVKSWGDLLTGITPTTDPLNGTTRDVWTGPKSGYWINGQGDVLNSNLSPGADWRPLQPQ